MADLYNVQNGNVAMAEDVNQYKTALEGGSAQQFALVQKAGADMIFRLSPSRGLSVQDSAGYEVARIDEDGTVTAEQFVGGVFTGPSLRRSYAGMANASLVKNTNTTFSDIPQLGFVVPDLDVVAANAVLYVNTDASAGIKVAVTTTDNTQILSGVATFYTASGVSSVVVADMTAGVGVTAAVVRVDLAFGILPALGTYQVQAAQNASHASDTTIYSLSQITGMGIAAMP